MTLTQMKEARSTLLELFKLEWSRENYTAARKYSKAFDELDLKINRIEQEQRDLRGAA